MSLTVDIQKTLGDFRLDVQLEADDGITGILGASGAGKSMTLRCIAGIDRPDSGSIVLNGTVLFDSRRGIDVKPQQRRVGYLFQSYALFPNMTVRQNILAGLSRTKDSAARERILKEHIELLQLSGLEDRCPAALSGGQQQRVALARILASQPNLLLLDEPFSALDAHLRETLLPEMQMLLRRVSRPALLVTHSRNEAYTLSDSIATMDGGRIHAHKPKRQLFADPETVAGARVTGCKNIAPAQRIDAHTLLVPDWGIALQTALSIREGLTAVGIRAHHFSEHASENRHPVRIESVIEEPFEDTLRFRFDTQPEGTPALTWRRAKQTHPAGTTLGIAPADVLPLYESAMLP